MPASTPNPVLRPTASLMGAVPVQRLITTDEHTFYDAMFDRIHAALIETTTGATHANIGVYQRCALSVSKLCQDLGHPFLMSNIHRIKIHIEEEQNYIDFTVFQNGQPDCEYRMMLQKKP